MKNRRKIYLLILACIITLGIISRKLAFVPLCIGDILYGSMIYFMVRLLLLNSNAMSITVLALIICFGIEFLQLYQSTWMLNIRNTLFGRYVLGVGFLWLDLLWYTIGIYFAFSTEKMILKTDKNLS
jgi:hypothetical protein